MVWIKDIWFYFLKETEEKAFYDKTECCAVFSENEYTVIFPKLISKPELIREYIYAQGDRQLYERAVRMSDVSLMSMYRGHLTDEMLLFFRKRVMEYAAEWCETNGVPYTLKDDNIFSDMSYLYSHLI